MSLETLASGRFPRRLTASERKLLSKAERGEVAYCGPSPNPGDPSNDPAKAEKSKDNPGWGQDREVGADLLRWICTDSVARVQVDPWGIRIQGARITGSLVLAFVTVPFPIRLQNCALAEDALFDQMEIPRLDLQGSWTKSVRADGVIVKGDLFLRSGFRADGAVRLRGAQVNGQLDCDGGTFNNGDGDALSADDAEIRGGVFLGNGFAALGAVRLPGVRIGGNLECVDGVFNNPGRYALNANRAEIRETVLLDGKFNAVGEVNLMGAQIGGSLRCNGGTFVNPGGYALNVDRAEIKESVYLNDEFSAIGEVNLMGAKIGGNLDCDHGTFNNSSGDALNAERVAVKGNAFLRGSFSARGIVSLLDARLEGDLVFEGATFREATLDLRDASASGTWGDPASWPQAGRLRLDGFVYGRLAGGPRDAASGLKWLALQRKFATQPYLQLAKVLREAGDDGGAVSVLEEMERLRRQHEDGRRPDRRALSRVFDESIGYGYAPARAIWLIAGLSGLGWILYRRSYLAGGIVPTEREACSEFKRDGEPPDRYEPFAPLVYSLENSLPLVKLGQAEKWRPDPDQNTASLRKQKWIKGGAGKRWAQPLRWLEHLLVLAGLLSPVDPTEKPSSFARTGTSPRFLRWFLWFQILLGWLLATLFVAGVTGIIRKD